MSLRRRWLLPLLAAAALLVPLAAGAPPAAADTVGTNAVELEPVLADLVAGFSDEGLSTTNYMDATLPNGRISLMVRLDGPSVLDMVGHDRVAPGGGATPMSVAAISSIHDQLIARQAPFEQAFRATGADIVSTFQVTMNGFHVHATPQQLASIAAMPGVAAISRAPILTLHNADVRAHLRAEEAMDELGLDGTGTTIAIIDTGVDYTHAGFGGPGTVAAYQTNDPEIVEDGTFPTAKVVGGYDFAGTLYSPGCPADPQPPMECTGAQPDEDPLDGPGNGVTSGHGSHVAGTAGGIGTDTVPAGLAPAANIVALKVFGNPVGAPASTDVSSEAVEWATAHNLYLDEPDSEHVVGIRPEARIDVINMSLGSGYGPGASEANRIVQAAVDAGITVVISAGNSGNSPYIVGSPSTAEQALTVSNTHARNTLGGTVNASWENADGPGELVDELATTDTGWAADLEAMGPLTGELAWYGMGCNGLDGEPVQDVTEKIALVERGNCNFTEKVINAETNGAVAVLMFSDPARPKGGMGGTCEDCPTIPVLMVDRSTGLMLRGLVSPDEGDPTTVTVTMEKGPVDFLTDTIAGSSSRGPARFSGLMKPNISAPGQETSSVNSGTGTQAHNLSGTSMSGPAVAGVAALMWQRSREQSLSLGAVEISALLMNYAHAVIHEERSDTGPLLGVTRQGSGLADAFRSGTAGTVVQSDVGIAELSFGDVHVTDDVLEVSRVLTMTNFTDNDKTFALDYSFLFPDEDEGMGVTFSHPDSVEVGGWERVPVTITLEVDPEGVREWADARSATVITAMAEPRLREQEIDGFIQFWEIDDEGNEIAEGDKPHVPFLLTPRRHTCVDQTIDDDFVLSSMDDIVENAWVNGCSTEARVLPHYLGGVDKLESETNPDHPAELDLGAVGIDYGIANVTQQDGTVRQEPIIVFYGATAGPRRTIFDGLFDFYIDTDADGTLDRTVRQWPLSNLDQTAPGGVFVAITAPLAPGTLLPIISTQTIGGGYYVPFNIDESVTALAVPLAALSPDWNLDSGELAFDFAVALRDGMNDYEVTDTFLGEDMAPDGMVDGARFRFSQAANSCLMVEGRAQDGSAVNLIGQVAGPLAPQQQGNAPIKLSCVPEGAHEVGVFTEYRDNIPDTRAWDVRAGVIGVSEPAPIFLPYLNLNFDQRPPEPAALRLLHASPDAPAVDVWVDGIMAAENVGYQDITEYIELPSGSREIMIVAAGTTEPAVLTATVDLAPETHTTVAAVGPLAMIEAVAIGDSMSLPDEDQSNVRFVHFASDGPAVDVAVAGGEVLFSNVAFKDGTAYMPVDAGSYDLEVRVSGSEEVALLIPAVSLESDTIYTVFATGLVGGEPGLDAVIAVDGMAAAMPLAR